VAEPTAASRRTGDTAAIEVSGPIAASSGKGQAPPNMPRDVAKRYGYVEEEYFVSGEATGYTPVGELGSDGEWQVEPAGTEPFTTRIKVRRPKDMKDFSGNVVVEWFNVTAGNDIDPDFGLLNPLLLERGDAYVGVSAQRVGVAEGPGLKLDVPGAPPPEATLPLKSRDPERYAALSHPGDDYSYDIATQVGNLARNGDLLKGHKVDHVVLVGQSQSGGRVATYINAVHPIAKTFDGFLVHSRGPKPPAIAQAAEAQQPAVSTIRTDLDVPVLQYETEADVGDALHFLPARQPDTKRVMTWEVAGTAHADDAIVKAGQRSTGTEFFDIFAVCGSTPNTGPHAEVLRAGFDALTRWVYDGTRPPKAPLLETSGDALVRDEHNNVLGGIRTPDVDAPIAALTPQNDAENRICSLFGETIAFTQEQLAELYPTHADYVRAVTKAADAALKRGFLLRADRNALVAAAKKSDIPG
jgi:hypothetical protein